MEKKNFKVYEAPAVEVVELEIAGSILAGSPGDPDTSVTEPSECW